MAETSLFVIKTSKGRLMLVINGYIIWIHWIHTIDGLKDQQVLTELKIQHMIAGKVKPHKKRYVDLAMKLRKIVELYSEESSDIEYLPRIAFCI